MRFIFCVRAARPVSVLLATCLGFGMGEPGSVFAQPVLGGSSDTRPKSPFPDLVFADSALLGAISRGDVAATKEIVAKDPEILNQPHRSGYWPLGVAARIGNKELVAFLLEKGAEPQAASRSSYAPLVMAVQSGNKEVVQMLIDKGLDIANYGAAAVTGAVRAGNKEMITFLVDKGADLDGSRNDYSPLQGAIQNNNKDMVAFLLEKGANPNGSGRLRGDYSYGSSPLMSAVQNNYKEIVGMLVAKGADIMAQSRGEGQSALSYAISNNRKELVEAMITKNVDLNAKDRRGQTVLHAAMASSGYGTETVELILDKGADPNVRNAAGLTPLHLAAQSGNATVVSLLVARKADAKSKTRMGDTPLHLAAAANQPAVGLELIEAGGDVNARNYRGDTPLHLALRDKANAPGRDAEAAQNFKVTLINKSDVNLKDQFGLSALQLVLLTRQFSLRDAVLARKPKIDGLTAVFDAAARNDATELKKLLDEKPYLTFMRLPNGITPLHIAAQWGAKESVDLLLKKQADLNARDAQAITPLLRAVRTDTGPANSDAREIVGFLLTKGADATLVDENDNGVLHAAVQRGDKELAATLLAKKVDPNVRNKTNQTPLELLFPGSEYAAVRRGAAGTPLDKETVRGLATLLIEKGADITTSDGEGNTLLMRAATGRQKDLTSLLIEKGADVNARNNQGETALSRLASTGSYGANASAMMEVARLLIDKGADVNVRTQYGETILMRALSNAATDFAKFLIEKGADLSAGREGGESALSRIISSGNKDLLALAIAKKVDLNARDTSGYTALMRAALNANKEMVQMLLENGADPNGKMPNGQTVLDIATRARNNEILDLLKAKGAKESGIKTPRVINRVEE